MQLTGTQFHCVLATPIRSEVRTGHVSFSVLQAENLVSNSKYAIRTEVRTGHVSFSVLQADNLVRNTKPKSKFRFGKKKQYLENQV
jgi:hypothetical protein